MIKTIGEFNTCAAKAPEEKELYPSFVPYCAKNLKPFGSTFYYSTISKWSGNLEYVVFIES